MAPLIDGVGLWLADFHLLGTALLAVALVVLLAMRQPARRMSAVKSTLAALAVLAVLCALPGWSLIHVLSAKTAPSLVGASAPPAPVADPRVLPIPPARELTYFPVRPSAAPAASVQTPHDETALFSWPTALMMLHAAGSALVVVWLAVGAVLAWRVRRASQPAAPEIDRALRSIVGVAKPPDLLVSSTISTPLALGLHRPAIILPSAAIQPRPLAGGSLGHDNRTVTPGQSPGLNVSQQAEIASILAHEWAHIAAGDLRTLAASRVLLVLLWPQPLYWALRRKLRLDQETLADAAAAEVAGRVDYAEQLLSWARTAIPRAPRLAGAVGLWEGPSQLKRRIAVLLDEQLTVLRACSRRWRVGTACSALVAATLLSLVTLQRQEATAQVAGNEEGAPSAAVDPAPVASAVSKASPSSSREDIDWLLARYGYRARGDATPNVFSGRCLDEHGRALAGVKVSLHRGLWWSTLRERLGETTTDDNGEFRLDSVIDIARTYNDEVIPNASSSDEPMVACIAQYSGRVSREAAILQSEVARNGRAIDFVMPPGAALRGRITDPEGKPIAGALVAKTNSMTAIDGLWSGRSDANGEYVIDDLAPFDAESERRKQEAESGRNQFEFSASSADTSTLGSSLGPAFTVSHRDYSFQRLRLVGIPGVANAVLQPGGRIDGRVVQPDGTPAVGVTVRAYTSVPRKLNDLDIPMFDHGAVTLDDMYWATTVTDADGRYEFAGLRPSKIDVWVKSPGWFNRGQSEVEVAAGKTTVVEDLQLTHGGQVRIQFVEADGAPIRSLEKLEAHVLFVPNDRLSRQESWSTRYAVDGVGRLTATTRAGKVRMIVRQLLGVDGTLRWQNVEGDNPLKAPVVEVFEGETVDATIKVAPVVQPQPVDGTQKVISSELGQVTPAHQDAPQPSILVNLSPAQELGHSEVVLESNSVWTLVPTAPRELRPTGM